MNIPEQLFKFITKYHPKSLLMKNVGELYTYFYNSVFSTVEKLFNIKEDIAKSYGNSKSVALNIFSQITGGKYVYDIDFDNVGASTQDAVNKLLGISNVNIPYATQFEKLLYSLAKHTDQSIKLNPKNLKKKLSEQVTNYIFDDYNFNWDEDLSFTSETTKGSYLNKLVFLYLAYGENELKVYLRREKKLSIKVINDLTNYIKMEADIHKNKYRQDLALLDKARNIFIEVNRKYGINEDLMK